MADQVVWSPRAIEDVEAIASFITKDSPSYAAAVVRKRLDTTANLSKFPLSGRVVPELGYPDIREKLVYSYRIIYQVEADTPSLLQQ